MRPTTARTRTFQPLNVEAGSAAQEIAHQIPGGAKASLRELGPAYGSALKILN